jgi:hypothetical protein
MVDTASEVGGARQERQCPLGPRRHGRPDGRRLIFSTHWWFRRPGFLCWNCVDRGRNGCLQASHVLAAGYGWSLPRPTCYSLFFETRNKWQTTLHCSVSWSAYFPNYSPVFYEIVHPLLMQHLKLRKALSSTMRQVFNCALGAWLAICNRDDLALHAFPPGASSRPHAHLHDITQTKPITSA